MKKMYINGYVFKYDENGIYPLKGNINFLDDGYADAIQRAVQRYNTGIAYVYLVYSNYSNGYKIGKANNPIDRAGSGVIHTIDCPGSKAAFRLEAFFHAYFGDKVIGTEKEVFDLSKADIEWFMGFNKSEDVPRELPEGAISPKSTKHPRNIELAKKRTTLTFPLPRLFINKKD